MYSTGVCPFCLMAERLLRAKGVAEIEKVRVDLEPARREEMMQPRSIARADSIPCSHPERGPPLYPPKEVP